VTATSDQYVGAILPTVPGVSTAHVVAFLVMTTALVAAPFFVYPVFLMKALCFALFACAFNLLIGYVGLLSFGHAIFLGSAGYGAAHSAKVWGFPPELAIVFGTAAAAALGVVVGALAIRSKGIYFANITLAFAQMAYFFSLQAVFTGGEDGIQSVPRGKFLGLLDLHDNIVLYYVVLAIFTATNGISRIPKQTCQEMSSLTRSTVRPSRKKSTKIAAPTEPVIRALPSALCVVATSAEDPQRLAAFRTELDALIEKWFHNNRVRQSFLMTRALKR